MTAADERAGRIISFIADAALFDAIDAAAADYLLPPAEFVRRLLVATFRPATQDQPN